VQLEILEADIRFNESTSCRSKFNYYIFLTSVYAMQQCKQRSKTFRRNSFILYILHCM